MGRRLRGDQQQRKNYNATSRSTSRPASNSKRPTTVPSHWWTSHHRQYPKPERQGRPVAERQGAIAGTSFTNGNGMLGINQTAGANNQSINAVRVSINPGPQSIDDSVLLQQNTTTLATDSGFTPTTGSRQVVTSDQAFTGSRGVIQVNQSAGVGNRVANTLGITIK